MELRGLRSLLLLADLGSIAKCAEQLHLSAAAIHKQLKVLESELDVQLYERAGRRLRLTQAAEILLPHVRSLLAESDTALSALSEWKGLKHGTVRVGTGPTMSSYLLPPVLEEFRRRCPEVELFVETGHFQELVSGLSAGSLDTLMLVSSELIEQPHLTVEHTWDYELVLVSGRRGSPRRCRISDLSDSPFILYKKGGLFEAFIDSYFAEAGFKPRVIMRFDNAEAIKAMIRLGLGISVLPMWVVDAELRQKTLFLIRQKEHPLIGKIALVRRKTGYVPQPVAAFLDVARNWSWKNARLVSR
jgi:LysR family transcriptional activator of glutamate synthase operon